MGKLWRKFYLLMNRSRIERELADEMAAHREMMAPDRRRNFGNPSRLQEESREAWSWQWLDQLLQDLGYGVRVLAKARGFTLGTVAVLALGVGVNLAEFQIFDAMIFHRLTIRDAASCLQFTRGSREGRRLGYSAGAIDFYRTESRSFAWLVSEDQSIDVMIDGETGLRSNLVSPNYFAALGIVPAWGRLLDQHDAEPGAPAVAVISYDYWQTHAASDPNIVGRVIRVNNYPVQVAGVAPYDFDGLMARRTAVYLPVPRRPVLVPGSSPPQHDFSRATQTLYGKLKPNVSQPAGEAELTSLTRELARMQPLAFAQDELIRANPLQDSMWRTFQRFPAIAILILIILLVLLSACANLGNLLLARGLTRQREIHIRLAIGASRARLVRQLMTENLLLAVLGSVAGVAFGVVAARLLLYALKAPSNFHLTMRWSIFLVGFILTLLSAVTFGLPSALQSVRPNHRKIRLRQSLVGVQVAVSCLLLIAVGTLAHNGIASASIDLAFDYRNMVVVYPQLYGRNLTPAAVQQKLDALTAEFRALPGVDGVGVAVVPPLGGRVRMNNVPGAPRVYANSVASSYFDVMKLPPVRGQVFLPGEDRAVIVSESAAHAMWPNQEPIGKTFTMGRGERAVVGVVKDSGANLLVDMDSVEIYLPFSAADLERSTLILHTRGEPGTVTRLALGAASRLNESISVTLMSAARENVLEGQGRLVKLIGSIGLVATVLAAAGMFALVAFAVAQRRRELGIRIAIGAGPRQILAILVSQNVRPMAIGAVTGAILAAILSRLVRGLMVLPHSGDFDVIGFICGIAGFALVALLATISPAMRALRIDPSTTLHEE